MAVSLALVLLIMAERPASASHFIYLAEDSSKQKSFWFGREHYVMWEWCEADAALSVKWWGNTLCS